MALVSNKSLAKNDWYFDSGCSRHMTHNKNLLIDIIPQYTSYATFGDGTKGEIIGYGNIRSSGGPNLNGVLLVKGLTTNLISIGQLCDKSLKVKFS